MMSYPSGLYFAEAQQREGWREGGREGERERKTDRKKGRQKERIKKEFNTASLVRSCFRIPTKPPKYVRALGAAGHISVPDALEKKEKRERERERQRERERDGSSSDRLREPWSCEVGRTCQDPLPETLKLLNTLNPKTVAVGFEFQGFEFCGKNSGPPPPPPRFPKSQTPQP